MIEDLTISEPPCVKCIYQTKSWSDEPCYRCGSENNYAWYEESTDS